jgi:hypothetical protein
MVLGFEKYLPISASHLSQYNHFLDWAQWLAAVIPATQEAEIQRITV